MEAFLSFALLAFIISIMVGLVLVLTILLIKHSRQQFNPARTGHYRLPWNIRAFERGSIPDKFTGSYISGELKREPRLWES